MRQKSRAGEAGGIRAQRSPEDSAGRCGGPSPSELGRSLQHVATAAAACPSRDLELDGTDRAIVAAVVGLAHALSPTAPAEGVETHRQLAAFMRSAATPPKASIPPARSQPLLAINFAPRSSRRRDSVPGQPGTLGGRPSRCARSSTDRASDYGSEGWGFESLRAHSSERFAVSSRPAIASIGVRRFEQ